MTEEEEGIKKFLYSDISCKCVLSVLTEAPFCTQNISEQIFVGYCPPPFQR